MVNGILLRLTGAALVGLCLGIVYYAASFLQPSGFSFTFLLAIVWIIFLMWEGVSRVSDYLDLRQPWSKGVLQRAWRQLLLGGMVAFLVVNIPYGIYKYYSLKYYERAGSEYFPHVFLLINGVGLMLFLVVTALHLCTAFLLRWQRAELTAERLQKESVQARLETLKSQLQPHFLFNNLNILSLLIEQDPPGAKDFLERFAQVYRYVLVSRKKELVALREELSCLQDYLFLLEKRFEGSLQMHLTVPDKQVGYLPPLSLQLLVENAFKHNIASEKKPLRIEIFLDKDNHVVVRNTYQPRLPAQPTTGIGLGNIARRYEYLSDKQMIVEQTAARFTVRLPLLQLEPV